MRRKRIQLEHAREHDEAVVTLKQKVRVCGCASAQGRALVWWVQLEHLREHDDAVVALEQRARVCVEVCGCVNVSRVQLEHAHEQIYDSTPPITPAPGPRAGGRLGHAGGHPGPRERHHNNIQCSPHHNDSPTVYNPPRTTTTQVRELEGQDMREVIQDRVNAWFVENRNDVTGEYPDFPDPDDGGSKVGCAWGQEVCGEP